MHILIQIHIVPVPRNLRATNVHAQNFAISFWKAGGGSLRFIRYIKKHGFELIWYVNMNERWYMLIYVDIDVW